jgi:hypothetical protein
MRSELLVALEKHGQLPLLKVYVVPVQMMNKSFNNIRNRTILFFMLCT